MIDLLREQDPNLVELNCGRGSVLLPPSLAGRIFCAWDGELVHRLDGQAYVSPVPGEYNNLGGNSLWPAPEGGPFAFNYGPGDDIWVVQEGIATAPPEITPSAPDAARLRKEIQLLNRKGVRADLHYNRGLLVRPADLPPAHGVLDGIVVDTEDCFSPQGDYRTDDLLIAPWSLEQFPGAEGVTAFGLLEAPEAGLNLDFYGDPGARLVQSGQQFTFRLGGEDRHQIGIPVASKPVFIGALDFNRSLLLLRTCAVAPGMYFNIADNAQPEGPFSAADQYSIFNGGALGFFELETIGAMNHAGGKVLSSSLYSQTTMLWGPVEALLDYLQRELGITL